MAGIALPTANPKANADAGKGSSSEQQQQQQIKDGTASALQDYKNSGGADAAIQQGLPLPVLQ